MKVSNFITMSEKEYRRSGATAGETLEITLSNHQLFDMSTLVPVIVRGVGCIGYAEINQIVLTKNGSTKVEFYLKGMSEKSKEAAYILYTNQAATGDNANETMIPGIYQSRTTGPKNDRRFVDDDEDIPGYLR